MRGPEPTKPCGTAAAAQRHRRRGEYPCPACLDAETRERVARRGQEPLDRTPDRREVRNGLPEFRPYIYGASRRGKAA